MCRLIELIDHDTLFLDWFLMSTDFTLINEATAGIDVMVIQVLTLRTKFNHQGDNI